METLETIFRMLDIPPTVASELAAKSLLFPQPARVQSLPFVIVTAPANQLLCKSLMTRVHPGEAECLALAMEHPGSLRLVGDLGAREIAAAMACFTPVRWDVWSKRRTRPATGDRDRNLGVENQGTLLDLGSSARARPA